MNFDVRKKRTKLPEMDKGWGGLGDSGNARKKAFFFIDVFPKRAFMSVYIEKVKTIPHTQTTEYSATELVESLKFKLSDATLYVKSIAVDKIKRISTYNISHHSYHNLILKRILAHSCLST